MKVLIVSDTHGQDENLEETVLREAPFDYLIHCGDVEGREIFIEALAECPCTIVAGNNDFFTDLPYEEGSSPCSTVRPARSRNSASVRTTDWPNSSGEASCPS